MSLLPQLRSSIPAAVLVTSLLLGTGPAVVAQKQPAGQADRLDQYGDPLPPGALARIGTVRFRTGSSVMTVRFSPDGKTLASVDPDAVVLWDPRTGKELHRLSRPGFYRANYSPDGRRLWLQTFEGAISVWELSAQPDRGPVPASLPGPHTWFVQPFPDGKLLATGAKNVVHIWDIASGKVIRELAYDDEVREVAVSPDSKGLAAYGLHGTVDLWDVQTGKKTARVPPNPKKDDLGHIRDEDSVDAFALSADGKRLATSFESQQLAIRLWDLPTAKEVGRFVPSGSAGRRLLFSPDGKTLALACQNSVSVWSVPTGKALWQTPVWGNQANDIAFSPDGKTLAVGLVCMVRLWDVA